MSARLPKGQKELKKFPRFGLSQFAGRFPSQTSQMELHIAGNVEIELNLDDALRNLPRVDQVSDFHCVTTWSTRSLHWAGVRFADFFDKVVVPDAKPLRNSTTLILRGQDGARTTMRLEDMLAPDVLLADQLDGKPLTVEHGAPLRLVAPAHYGYKSVKHLCRIEFRIDERLFRPSAFRFMDHPRARVALEERGRGVPGWLLRFLYRPLVAPTIKRFSTAMESQRKTFG